MLAVAAPEMNPLRAHLIEIRCLDDGMPFDAKAVAALLVGRDENEIRTGRHAEQTGRTKSPMRLRISRGAEIFAYALVEDARTNILVYGP